MYPFPRRSETRAAEADATKEDRHLMMNLNSRLLPSLVVDEIMRSNRSEERI